MQVPAIAPRDVLTCGLFAVRTCHGTVLQIDTDANRVVHAPLPGPARLRSVVLYVPRQAASLGFLMSAEDGGAKLLIHGDPAARRIIPVRLQRTSGDTPLAICHPLTGRYVCAGPILLERDTFDVVIDRAEAGVWEAFTLLPMSLVEADPSVQRAAALLDLWAQVPLTGPHVLETLNAWVGPASAHVFEALGWQLPYDQLAWLGQSLLSDPRAVSRLAAAFPDDVFASEALPALRDWLTNRPKVAELQLPASRDSLAVAGLDGAYTSLAHICNAQARRSVPARKTLCVLATARNEGLYLVEWIAYHRSIGIEDFFIYSNDNSDGSDALLAALAQAGVITWVNSEVAPGHGAQPKAYGHALGVLPQILDSRWTLIIDLDEFFVFDHTRFASARDYIAWQESRPVDAIALNWLVYGSSGAVSWRDKPLASRFVRRLPWIDKHVKSVVRTNLVLHSRPHHPSIDNRQTLVTRNGSGVIHIQEGSPSFSAEPESNTAWINHYFLKSAEEFVLKFSRNRGDYALIRELDPSVIDHTFIDMFMSQHDSPNVDHDARIAAFGSGQAEQTEILLSLPGVTQAVRSVQDQTQHQLERLKAMIWGNAAFQGTETPAGRLGDLLRHGG